MATAARLAHTVTHVRGAVWYRTVLPHPHPTATPNLVRCVCHHKAEGPAAQVSLVWWAVVGGRRAVVVGGQRS